MRWKPRYPWASATWYEVRYDTGRMERVYDRRRRTKAACEKIVEALRAEKWIVSAWVVERNKI